jgi:hypothetical protein
MDMTHQTSKLALKLYGFLVTVLCMVSFISIAIMYEDYQESEEEMIMAGGMIERCTEIADDYVKLQQLYTIAKNTSPQYEMIDSIEISSGLNFNPIVKVAISQDTLIFNLDILY